MRSLDTFRPTIPSEAVAVEVKLSALGGRPWETSRPRPDLGPG